MASDHRRLRTSPSELTDRLAFKPLAVLLLVPIIVIAGVLMAIVLIAPFAGIAFGAKTIDTRLTAAGADFTHIPQFPVRSTIYANDGKTVLASIYLENRELVHLDEVSPITRQAVLAIEDSSFYDHGAVNWNSMIRALVEDAKAGSVVQGGSTITQQLVKNTLPDANRSFANKFQELAISLRVEQKYTKDQILELYLNQVYLGNGIDGIGTAADFYFHKPASQLSLGEGAMLAGMIRAPEYWNPLDRHIFSCFNKVTRQARTVSATATCHHGEIRTNRAGLTKLRRNDVLNRMMALGYITPERAAEAAKQPLGLAEHVGKVQLKQPPFFVTYLTQQILTNSDGAFDAMGKTEQQRKDALYEGGLKIYTTLDPKWQAAAQAAANEPWAVPPTNTGYRQKPDVSIVSIDNATGAIRTMLSGRNYDQAHLDLANTPHQPGSSFKPYVLAAAFEEGIPPTKTYSTQSPLYLSAWTGNACSCVMNAEGPGNIGFVNLYTATTESINVVFAQLIFDVGPEKVVKVAHRMGITSELPAVPALAVGSVGITPIEQASGFQTIADSGLHCPPYTVEKIVDAGGVLLQHEPDCTRAIPTDVADTITGMLRNVVTSGTGWHAALDPWLVAGKTGTAQDNTSVWFAGYTHQVTTAVWVGFPGRPESLVNYFGQSVFGGTVSAPIWHDYMMKVMKGLPALGFPRPPSSLSTPSGTPTPSTYVTVPSVVGATQNTAAASLERSGFVVTVTVVDDAASKGTVVGQTPAAGSSAAIGSIVTIQVSNGHAPTSPVPNVVGKSEADAIAELQADGFVVAVEKVTDPQHVGVVVGQSVPPGTKLSEGSTVTITVGKK
jgi:penicillin-binding protein 1A